MTHPNDRQSYGRFTSKARIAHIKAGAREMDRNVAEMHLDDTRAEKAANTTSITEGN